MPSVIIRKFVGALRMLSRFKPAIPTEVIQIAPPEPLGSAKDMLYWRRENIDRWIAHGATNGLAVSCQVMMAI